VDKTRQQSSYSWNGSRFYKTVTTAHEKRGELLFVSMVTGILAEVRCYIERGITAQVVENRKNNGELAILCSAML
jgi:hypothetical protein